MRKTIILFVLMFFLHACLQSQSSAKGELKKINEILLSNLLRPEKFVYQLDELVGVWGNSAIADLQLGLISLNKYFYPCHGFSISKIKPNGLRIFIQYSEQKQVFSFNNVSIKKGEVLDTLIGINQKRTKEIIALIYPNKSIDLKILDYSLLKSETPMHKTRYSKLSNRECEGDFQNSIIESIFNLLPLKIVINQEKYLIKRSSFDNCGLIRIVGLKNYKFLQINNYEYDRLNAMQIFNLSFSTGKGDKNKFLEIRRDRFGNSSITSK